MRALHIAGVVTALAGSLVASPASAGHGTVTSSATAVARPNAGGYLVAVACSATVDAVGEVPLSTTVTCSVNGIASTVTAPGGAAATVVQAQVAPPMAVCISSSATILDPATSTTYVVTDAEECLPIGP